MPSTKTPDPGPDPEPGFPPTTAPPSHSDPDPKAGPARGLDSTGPDPGVVVRPMRRSDLAEAGRVLRLAFEAVGRPLPGVPGPGDAHAKTDAEADIAPSGDADASGLRDWLEWQPDGVLVAEVGENVMGLLVVYPWGSVGLVGPLGVHPACWGRGVGSRLMEEGRRVLQSWGCTHTELYTFAHSARHLDFFQRCGFRARGLHGLCTREVRAEAPPPPQALLSSLLAGKRWLAMAEIDALMHLLHPGLRLHREVEGRHPPVADVLLLRCGAVLQGVALCDLLEHPHASPGAEGVSASARKSGTAPAPRTCHLRFAAVRPGVEAARFLQDLLDLCARFALSHGCTHLSAGVGPAHGAAARLLAADGWTRGEEMMRLAYPEQDGFHHEGNLVLGGWM